MAEAPADDAALKDRARVMWGLGDYDVVGRRLEPAAEALVEAAGVEAGHEVLDVAAGTGNVALAAAARGARVTASDLAPVLIATGRERTAAAGHEVSWVEADAEALPFPDEAFDRTLSAFGAIFAPDPHRAAAELLRVTRPGGVAALTAWTSHGFMAEVHALMAHHLRPPPGREPMQRWGEPDVARERLGPHAAEVRTELRTLHWTWPSARLWFEEMERHAPPIIATRSALGEETWAEVRSAVFELVAARGADGPDGFVVEPEYLLILARRG